MLNNAYQ